MNFLFIHWANTSWEDYMFHILCSILGIPVINKSPFPSHSLESNVKLMLSKNENLFMYLSYIKLLVLPGWSSNSLVWHMRSSSLISWHFLLSIKYFLRNFCVLGTVPGTGNISESQIDTVPAFRELSFEQTQAIFSGKSVHKLRSRLGWFLELLGRNITW